MEARKLRTGQTENGFHLRCGSAPQEQFFGNPQVRDTPIGMRKTLGNLETVQPGLIDRGGLGGRDDWDGVGRKWSRLRRDMRMWRQKETGKRRGARQSMRRSLHQKPAVGGQTSSGMEEFHPRRASGGQAALRLLIGESSQSSQVAPVRASPVCLVQASQVPTDLSRHRSWQRFSANVNPSLKMPRAGLNHRTRFMAIGAHRVEDRWLGVVQIDQNVAGVVVNRIGPEIDVIAFAVTHAEKSYGWLKQELGSGPQPFAGEWLSGVVVNQADEILITATGHGRELLADSSQRKKESRIQHSGSSAALMHGRGFGVGSELEGAPYGETLQATGRTTRIINRLRDFAPILSKSTPLPSACLPPRSALAWRATQLTMAFGSSHAKEELSTLLGIGTFYFALTPCGRSL